MKYKEIHMTLSDHPDRLNRTIIVREKTPLIELGIILGASVRADFTHFFVFHVGKKIYEAQMWTEQFEDEDAYSMMNYTIEDLGNEFIYEYDTGDGWEFDCKVDDLDYADMSKKKSFLVTEGEGLGIFEDCHYTLDEYLDGNIPEDMDEDDEENGFYMPINLDMMYIGEFDDPLDLEDLTEEMEDCIDDMADDISEDYRRNEPYLGNGFGQDYDEAMEDCHDDLEYCYEKLSELMDGVATLNDSLTNKYGKQKGKEILKAIVMNHLVDLIEEEED